MAKSHRSIPKLTPQDVARFWSHVDLQVHTMCWEWKGYRDRSGYGRFQLGKQPYPATRIVVTLCTKVDPGEKLVCHTCDNPPCCNPYHLYAGTPADNTRDAIERGSFYTAYGDDHWSRQKPELIARGEKAGGAKLTERDIRDIRSAHDSSHLGKQELALRYGVSRKNISQIVNRKTWRHVD